MHGSFVTRPPPHTHTPDSASCLYTYPAHLLIGICWDLFCSATLRAPFVDMLRYLRIQLFDSAQRINGKIWKQCAVNVRIIAHGGRRPINQWVLPTRREHSSHLSSGISGLVTSRANLLQRSVALNPPVVLSTCPWMSAGTGRILGRPIDATTAVTASPVPADSLENVCPLQSMQISICPQQRCVLILIARLSKECLSGY